MLNRSSLAYGLNYVSLNQTIAQLNNQKRPKTTALISKFNQIEPKKQLHISTINRIEHLKNRKESNKIC